MTDRYAVMGNPVAHSKSPQIHRRFAEATGEDIAYSAIHVEEGDFARAVADFFDGGGKGLNITVPFKQEAWALADVYSENAEYAGAVNTLFRDNTAGVMHGHNTDGLGLVRDITHNHQRGLQGSKILILGAGGATRGILQPLLKQEPAALCIANRSVDKAESLAENVAALGEVRACGLNALEGQRFDWVINASSASLQGELPPLPADLLEPGACCYDLMYADTETVFCRWAREAGASLSVDGLGMLVEQAAESFYLWRGVRPETAAVIAALRP